MSKHVETHYKVLYNERWVYPTRGRCFDREKAVSEVRCMVKNGLDGVELYEIQVFRNTRTTVQHEKMTKQWVPLKDCVLIRFGKQHQKETDEPAKD